MKAQVSIQEMINLFKLWESSLPEEKYQPDGRFQSDIQYANVYRSHSSCLPLSILTATVSQLLLLLIPKAEASMTFPKAPWPRTLPENRILKTSTVKAELICPGKNTFYRIFEDPPPIGN